MRKANDFYPTIDPVTLALFAHYPAHWPPIGGVVGEVCAGDGRMAFLIGEQPGVERALTNDIDPQREVNYNGNAANPDAFIYTAGQLDWVITNPPYSRAADIVRASLQSARVGVAMLLRVTFLEPCQDRRDLLADPRFCAAMPLNPRPKFRADKKGTDSATVAWMIWLQRPLGFQYRPITDWKEGRYA